MSLSNIKLEFLLLQLRPEKVQTTCDCPPSSSLNKDVLPYRSHDLITVLDKRYVNILGTWTFSSKSVRTGSMRKIGMGFEAVVVVI